MSCPRGIYWENPPAPPLLPNYPARGWQSPFMGEISSPILSALRAPSSGEKTLLSPDILVRPPLSLWGLLPLEALPSRSQTELQAEGIQNPLLKGAAQRTLAPSSGKPQRGHASTLCPFAMSGNRLVLQG